MRVSFASCTDVKCTTLGRLEPTITYCIVPEWLRWERPRKDPRGQGETAPRSVAPLALPFEAVRRLLLIAYHFPPEPAAGSLRPGYLAKYLPQHGWEVTVLTRPVLGRNGGQPHTIEAAVLGEGLEGSIRQALDRGKQAGNPSPGRPSFLRRMLRWGKSTLLFPDRAAGWLPTATIRADRLLRSERFDAILSTAMPATVHLVAGMIAPRHGLPWIADYRDPWSGNRYSASGPVRSIVERLLERRLLRRASAVTTISPAVATHLEFLLRRPVIVIPNATDPDDWRDLPPTRPPRFRLCYTGSLYDGYRTPALLFQALAALRESEHPAASAAIDFYGPNSDHVTELARRYSIAEAVQQHGTVTRPQALAAQRTASHLLIFLNMDRSTSTELGSKIYEYESARRPILAFGPRDSVMREYISDRGLGWFASDLDEAKNALEVAYLRWLSGDYDVSPERSSGLFQAQDLAATFADLLDTLVR